MSSNEPQYLYRYCTADRASQILRDKYLYLAGVDQLNDRFESSVGTVLRYSPAAAHKVSVFRLCALGGASREVAEDITSRMSESKNRETFDVFMRGLQERNRELRKYTGVVCFSASFNDQRMWGTYGDSHRGVCIQFWGGGDHPVIVPRAMPVHYTDDTILDLLLGLLNEHGELEPHYMSLFFLTKSADWAEENEWRVVGCAAIGRPASMDAPAPRKKTLFISASLTSRECHDQPSCRLLESAQRSVGTGIESAVDWSVQQIRARFTG